MIFSRLGVVARRDDFGPLRESVEGPCENRNGVRDQLRGNVSHASFFFLDTKSGEESRVTEIKTLA